MFFKYKRLLISKIIVSIFYYYCWLRYDKNFISKNKNKHDKKFVRNRSFTDDKQIKETFRVKLYFNLISKQMFE